MQNCNTGTFYIQGGQWEKLQLDSSCNTLYIKTLHASWVDISKTQAMSLYRPVQVFHGLICILSKAYKNMFPVWIAFSLP